MGKPTTAHKVSTKRCSSTAGAGWKSQVTLTAPTTYQPHESQRREHDRLQEYQEPIETEELTVKPIMAKLGPVHKGRREQSCSSTRQGAFTAVADEMQQKAVPWWTATKCS